MIVFGCPILHEEVYERFARPTIDALSEPGASAAIEKRGYDSIQQPYNEILEEAAADPDLEAVVLLHEDTAVDEPALPELIRWHMRDPDMGVLGAVGARGVTGLDWWNATVVGWAATPKISADTLRYSVGPQLADAVDGYLLIISPAVARRVRFDERGKRDFHGYDVDFCFRVRAAGYKVVVDDIRTRHYSLGGDPDDASWARAAAAWRRTWHPERWDPAWRGSAPYGFFR